MTLAEFNQIAKDILGAAHLETVTATVRQILPVSRDRQVLIFSPPSAGRVTVWPDVNTSIGGGFNINWNDSCFWLSGAKDGGIVKKRWFAIAQLGDGPITDRWSETATGTNVESLAEHAAVADRRHQVEGWSGSFVTAEGLFAMQLEVNTAPVRIENVLDRGNFPGVRRAIEGAADQSVGCSVPDGGVGIVGRANIWGVTVDAGDGGIDLGIIEGLTRPELVT